MYREKGWTGARKAYLERVGTSMQDIERESSDGVDRSDRYKQADKAINERQTWHRICNSSYFPLYRHVYVNNVPRYFHLSYSLRTILAKARCGNFMQDFIVKECTHCSEPAPTLNHQLRCYNLEDMSVCDLMADDGGGLQPIKLILKNV